MALSSSSFEPGKVTIFFYTNVKMSGGKLQGRSLFVRGLSDSVTSEALTSFFSQSYPLKHATVVLDPSTKKSKGYGFVTFADVEDTHSAREKLNGALLEGQRLRVKLAEPRQRQIIGRTFDDGNLERSRPIRQEPKNQPPPKLIVRNLPWTIKKPDDLSHLFRSYGKVKHAIIPNKKPGLSAGFGFVVLRGRKNAERALIGMNGREVGGRTLAVDWAVEREVWEDLQSAGQPALDQNPTVDGSITGQAVDIESAAVVANEDAKGSHADDQTREDLSDDSAALTDEETLNDYHEMDSRPGNTDRNTSSLFVRNLPFSVNDDVLKEHFKAFGAVRYARVVLDQLSERPKGTGFVCFYNSEDADKCLQESPRTQPAPNQQLSSGKGSAFIKQSLLEDTSTDQCGRFTLDGRVLQVTRAVDRTEARRLTFAGNNFRDARDKDRRRLYLLSEGTVPSGTPLYDQLSHSEIKMREDSARQRQTLIRSNPTLHLSLTRLSVRNLPRSIDSKDLKALAREAAVGFAKDVKAGSRRQLSKEELARGGDEMKKAEKNRKAKGKGIVKQAKVIFEGREGGKVAEDSGAGRSRGYGFIEYSSHRWALMGLRWLNGHALAPSRGTSSLTTVEKEREKRLIVEFAIENAQVVGRRLERETKARERSKFVSEKRGKGEMPTATRKLLSKDQLLAKTRQGMKRKRTANDSYLTQDDAHSQIDTAEVGEKVAKRQQIIGKKRMMRKSRLQTSSN